MFAAEIMGAECCAISAGSTGPLGQISEPIGAVSPQAVEGMKLPSQFNTAHFLDPAFLVGMANELYAEDRPPGLPSSATEAGEFGMDAGALAHGAPEGLKPPGMPAVPAVRPDRIDWQDPRIFLGAVDDLLVQAPPASSDGLARSDPLGDYYFLTPQAQPALQGSKPAPLSSRPFQVEAIRQDFPILHQTVHGKPLIWLDNAATTQKPRRVIEAIARFYERDNSNVHRGAHTLAARATDLYESAREKVRRFLGAGQAEEIVFVHGVTEAINLVAQTYGRQYLGKGDEIVVSTIEHHANIVPWQQLVQEKGAVLRVVPVNDKGEVLLDDYEKLLGPRTKMVALTHVSNALGTVLPVRTMTQLAHRHGAKVLIDGAQSVPHLAVDVQAIDCDFFAFSGHKLFGPTGIGVLFGKRAVLEMMPPWQGGGNMIDQVTFEHTTYQHAPARFEAGTGILAGAVGLGAAIEYLDEIGLDNINRYEHELLAHGTEGLAGIPGVCLIGTAADKASVLSFILDGVRTEDMGRYLDHEGIAVRAGHHCAQPTMRRFGVDSTIRPSLAFYNTHEEVDALIAAVSKARNQLA
jgi:cysteine desulfurase/selenocysteine lyase